MEQQENILKRLDKLILLGAEIISGTSQYSQYADRELWGRWQTGVTALFMRTFGPKHTFTTSFLAETDDTHHLSVRTGHGIVQAARDDVANGGLNTLEDAITTGVLNGFLDTAEYLHERGYYHPAASLAGAVLEQGLRRMCEAHDITLKDKESISSLNQKLADAKVYSSLRRKTVATWNQIRNHADHGEFNLFSKTDVEQMLPALREFLSSVLD